MISRLALLIKHVTNLFEVDLNLKKTVFNQHEILSSSSFNNAVNSAYSVPTRKTLVSSAISMVKSIDDALENSSMNQIKNNGSNIDP